MNGLFAQIVDRIAKMQYSGEMFLKSISLSDAARHPLPEVTMTAQALREKALIINAQNGDLAAFNELVLIYQDVVYRQALWMLKEQEAAEDATQESLIKAYRKITMFQPGKPFRPWLLKITTNHCLDMIRAAERHRHLPYEPSDMDGEEMEAFWMKDPCCTPEQAVERAEAEKRIIHAIQRLPSAYKSVVILVDLQGLDYEEVATILGVPLGTMKSRLSRAREQLRKALLL
jgi:RNA polymerase sigma-70 factor (ECF subfamily)